MTNFFLKKQSFTQYLVIGFTFFTLFSCTEKSPNDKHIDFEEFVTFDYAKGISITKTTQGNIVTISNPQTGEVLDNFVVTKEEKNNFENTKTIKLPIKNIIAYSSTYLSFIDAFNEIKKVKGVTYSKGIFNPKIKKQITIKQTIDIGNEQLADKELILSLKPKLAMIYPSDGAHDWYKSFDIPTITNVEYLEIHPLAQAEWIKLYGILFDKEKLADSIFKSIEKQYNQLKNRIKSNTSSSIPTVLCGELFQGVWTLPGGKSFINKIIEDAGGKYFFENDTSTGSKKIDFETILKQDSIVDFWALLSYDNKEITKTRLLEKNERYKYLSIMNTNKIGVCNTAKNTYFEKGILEPHVLLLDLTTLIHKTKNKSLTKYFKQIKE